MATGCAGAGAGYATFTLNKHNCKRSLFASRSTMGDRRSNVQVLRSSPASIPKSAVVKTKVYEDEMRGIVCYQDEKGEMICEGYDEGPRYCQESSDLTRQLEHHLHFYGYLGRLGISTDMDLFSSYNSRTYFNFEWNDNKK